MIKVNVYESRKLLKLEISGHAGYAESGKDIICSAVSVLSINLVNSLEKFTKDKFFCDIKEDSGDLRLEVESPGESAKLLFNSCVLGLENISEEYGRRYLSLTYAP